MFVGQSLHSLEHGIGYSDLTFADDEGQKRLILCFKPPETPKKIQNLKSGHKSKNVPYKNLSKLGYLDLAFMADKGQKGQHLVLNLRNT